VAAWIADGGGDAAVYSKARFEGLLERAAGRRAIRPAAARRGGVRNDHRQLAAKIRSRFRGGRRGYMRNDAERRFDPRAGGG